MSAAADCAADYQICATAARGRSKIERRSNECVFFRRSQQVFWLRAHWFRPPSRRRSPIRVLSRRRPRRSRPLKRPNTTTPTPHNPLFLRWLSLLLVPRGWLGPGWYWCGYAWRSGYGWGGPWGWGWGRGWGRGWGYGHGWRLQVRQGSKGPAEFFCRSFSCHAAARDMRAGVSARRFSCIQFSAS